MTQSLTGLIPTIYTALSDVSRELIGFIPNVNVDAKASSAAVGQTVTAPVAGTAELEDIVPGADPQQTGGATNGNTQVQITKSKAYPIMWTGEEQLSVGPNGTYNTLLADQFSEGFRKLSNEVEADLGRLYVNAAQAHGTAGTTPFGTADNHLDFAKSNQLLDEVGAPQQGRIMILGSAARANVEGIQSGLFKVNEAGDAGAMLRNRQQRQIHGFTMGYSAGVQSHTAGDGASYLINDAALTAGSTEINVDGGTGTILAGDVVEIGGTNYVVASDLAAGMFTIGGAGLVADVADDTAVTLSAGFEANAVYHRNAFLLASRAPAMPTGGDEADDVMNVTDPVSGITFQVAVYRQYRQVKYEIGLAWGVAAPNGKHAGLLLG